METAETNGDAVAAVLTRWTRNAASTAEAGWRGFKAGKPLVIPRLINRFSVGVCQLLPKSLIVRFVGALQRPR